MIITYHKCTFVNHILAQCILTSTMNIVKSWVLPWTFTYFNSTFVFLCTYNWICFGVGTWSLRFMRIKSFLFKFVFIAFAYFLLLATPSCIVLVWWSGMFNVCVKLELWGQLIATCKLLSTIFIIWELLGDTQDQPTYKH